MLMLWFTNCPESLEVDVVFSPSDMLLTAGRASGGRAAGSIMWETAVGCGIDPSALGSTVRKEGSPSGPKGARVVAGGVNLGDANIGKPWSVCGVDLGM